jgi:hypothetical protein
MNPSSKDGKNESSQKQQSQDAGAQKQQQQSGEGKEYGEGNYKATRQYNEGLKEHVEHHDIEKEARDAAPKSPDEEREMEEAERIARSRGRGDEKGSPDDPEDQRDLTR